MKYQFLGHSGLEVSKIAFGGWGVGGGNVWSDMSPSVNDVASLLDAAYDLGINYIDTAPVYGIGSSETILGKALKGRRDRFIVQSKCSLNWRGEGGQFEYERDGHTVMRDHRASAIRRDVEETLERMELDHLDSLVVHRISTVVPVEETMGELMRLKEEGKIRAILLSNSTPEDFEKYAAYGMVDGVQERLSLLSPQKRSYFPTLAAHGATFQVYSGLENGALTGPAFFAREFPAGDIRRRPRWAVPALRKKMKDLYAGLDPLCEKYHCSYANLMQAWNLAQYEELNLLTGFRHIETMQDTCKVFDITLSAEDAEMITDLGNTVLEAEKNA